MGVSGWIGRAVAAEQTEDALFVGSTTELGPGAELLSFEDEPRGGQPDPIALSGAGNGIAPQTRSPVQKMRSVK